MSATWAELIAMYGDAKLRKAVLKRAQDTLAKQTRECRIEGRYRGGQGMTEH